MNFIPRSIATFVPLILYSGMAATQTAALAAPQLTVLASEGVTVHLSWTTVPDAQGYYLAYAPLPYTGPDSIQRIDVGNTGSYLVTLQLQQEQGFYVAIQAYDATHAGGYSNIEVVRLEEYALPGALPACTAGSLAGQHCIWTQSIPDLVTYETPYRDGIFHGIRRQFDGSGELVMETTYFDGVKHGFEIRYAADGSASERRLYIDGKLQHGPLPETFRWMQVRVGDAVEPSLPLCPEGQTPKTGHCIWRQYSNGRLYSEAVMRDGKLDGFRKFFNPETGAVTIIYQYRDDVVHGVLRNYYGATLNTRTPYVDGVFQGRSRAFSDGVLSSERTYRDGRPRGEVRNYWEDGALKEIFNLTPSLDPQSTLSEKDGWDFGYHANGALHHRAFYINGRVEGDYLAWHANGRLMYEALYRNGRRQGAALYYDEDGNLTVYEHYLDGERFGDQKAFYANGKLEYVLHYPEPGVENGVREYYYESGALKQTLPVVDGQFHGVSHYYDEQGKLTREVEYQQGRKIRDNFR